MSVRIEKRGTYDARTQHHASYTAFAAHEVRITSHTRCESNEFTQRVLLFLFSWSVSRSVNTSTNTNACSLSQFISRLHAVVYGCMYGCLWPVHSIQCTLDVFRWTQIWIFVVDRCRSLSRSSNTTIFWVATLSLAPFRVDFQSQTDASNSIASAKSAFSCHLCERIQPVMIVQP